MRTIAVILMLLLTLTACAGKEDVPADPAAADAATEQATPANENQAPEEEQAPAPEMAGPVGAVHMADGTVRELTRFEMLGKYYIYISGKLNGRSSTIISLTRLDDILHWRAIVFEDEHTITIIAGQDKRLRFTDARVYIGNDSYDTFSFHSAPPSSLVTELVTVDKKDVKAISFNQPKKDK